MLHFENDVKTPIEKLLGRKISKERLCKIILICKKWLEEEEYKEENK